MRALVLRGLEQPLELIDMDRPVPPGGWTLVQVMAAALNKRDYWITRGKYPGLVFPMTLGSDGVGLHGDRRVIIDPSIGWGDDPGHFAAGFRILGMPDPGTLSEWVAVPEANLHEIPAHLSWEEAAALPVCGVTAYRAMFTRGRARSGERMLITGIGGGVAMMAMLFGLAAGLEVWVTSSSDSKLTQAVEAGAAGGANYTRPEWAAELGTRLTGKIDLVIDGAGGEGFSELLPVMANRGRMVIYGGTRGPIHGLSPQRIFWKQLDILGSSMGSPDDFQAMLDFVSRHQVRPLVSDVFPMEDANRALALLARGDQSGKVVVRIGQ